jgi:hypothetical protein
VEGEFSKQIKQITVLETAEKLLNIVKNAGEEFPCLACGSRDECDSFKWFIKWFIKWFGTDFAKFQE